MSKKTIIVGVTGASGMPVMTAVLEQLREKPDVCSILIMSEAARLTLEQESHYDYERLCDLADEVYEPGDTGAPLASGSFGAEGMMIVPCSMKTLAGVHSGYADNLILRAADVTMKEGRPLVLAVREMPLSPIHLRNMYELSMVPGVHISPLMMSFYQQPESVDEMCRRVAARLLMPFGIHTASLYRWQGLSRDIKAEEAYPDELPFF